MFERPVYADMFKKCYLQRCVEELLPKGSQDAPVWAGYVVKRQIGNLAQPEKETRDSNGNSFVLQVHNRRIRVVGAGPDGKVGTKDDDVYPADLKGEAWVFDKRPRQPER